MWCWKSFEPAITTKQWFEDNLGLMEQPLVLPTVLLGDFQDPISCSSVLSDMPQEGIKVIASCFGTRIPLLPSALTQELFKRELERNARVNDHLLSSGKANKMHYCRSAALAKY